MTGSVSASGHTANSSVTAIKDQSVSNELVTSWGWGRPLIPKQSSELFAYKSFPWFIVYSVDLVLSFVLTSFICPHAVAIVQLFVFVVFVIVLALPSFAVIMVPFTWLSSGDGSTTLEEFFDLKDEEFRQRWTGHRVPLEALYEAYFEGKIHLKSGNESDLLQILYQRDGYARFVITWSHVKFFLFKLIPELLSHSRVQDVNQVREHYDRGDDFYEAFLGSTMVYTSGIFNSEEDTLEQAQINKLNLIANKIHLTKGDSHLDLGCGWGTCITHFAREFGTSSIGITLGLNQTEWANSLASRQNLTQQQCQALCMDYRDVPARTNFKKFNKITCLEMSEHVGIKYYSQFVRQVYDMLDDDGVFYLQIAGLRRPWQLEDFNWGLFMGKYIFPGADASCPLAWVVDKLEAGGFEVHSVENIGVHYSATIKRWYDNWQTNKDKIINKYGRRWFRLWSWFLAWSVISPEQGSATCFQIVAHKNTRHFNRKIYVAERTHWKV